MATRCTTSGVSRRGFIAGVVVGELWARSLIVPCPPAVRALSSLRGVSILVRQHRHRRAVTGPVPSRTDLRGGGRHKVRQHRCTPTPMQLQELTAFTKKPTRLKQQTLMNRPSETRNPKRKQTNKRSDTDRNTDASPLRQAARWRREREVHRQQRARSNLTSTCADEEL